MSTWVKLATVVTIAGAAAVVIPARDAVLGQTRLSTIAASSAADLRTWDARVNRMVRDGALTLRERLDDPLVPGRAHERYTQTVAGVPVYGGDVARQTDNTGLTVSIFGTIYEGIEIETEPALSPEEAQAIVEDLNGVKLGPSRRPRLAILPRDEGGYVLAYQALVANSKGVWLYFLDANTGAVVKKRSDMQTQSAVGTGTGVLGDRKKISALSLAGTFLSSDALRPPSINTYDMQSNVTRLLNILNGFIIPGNSDLGSDTDNDWTDGANVDAHVYQGYTYDYFFKRFARRGLNDRDIRIRGFTHPVNRNDVFTASDDILGLFYVNAFFCCNDIIVYGEGLPPNLVLLPFRQSWNYLAGALDVVGHELTHGVTRFSSNLVYEGESGALNEAFSDIMGASVEFFFQEPGTGNQRADYVIGEDVISPGTAVPAGLRSMENPRVFGDPDHYSNRYTGSGDNGGVHTNSGIPNNAFYLSIEGGTNRTSGGSVEGIGGQNRERMEKVWYRAVTQLLASNANFASARAACIQAARDLYGSNSNEERAVAQAWSAVGVN